MNCVTCEAEYYSYFEEDPYFMSAGYCCWDCLMAAPSMKKDYEKFKSLAFTEEQQKFVSDTEEELFWHFTKRLKQEQVWERMKPKEIQ